jgi:hypothetical protein
MTSARIELTTFGTGIRRATIAPRDQCGHLQCSVLHHITGQAADFHTVPCKLFRPGEIQIMQDFVVCAHPSLVFVTLHARRRLRDHTACQCLICRRCKSHIAVGSRTASAMRLRFGSCRLPWRGRSLLTCRQLRAWPNTGSSVVYGRVLGEVGPR